MKTKFAMITDANAFQQIREQEIILLQAHYDASSDRMCQCFMNLVIPILQKLHSACQ